jgi:prepilin-type processing-associated H-X9-DG protein/prepilin-type N-terminal cleavage/methylation domain-containing protein
MTIARQEIRASRHAGFTVLELLVAIAIVGVLMGLLLPALMSAREASRRMRCTNNLREIGVGVQQYHRTANRLPEAWSAVPDGISGYGWAIELFPFLEEAGVGRMTDKKLPIVSAQNDALRSTRLTVMLCPSDIAEETFELYPEKQVAPASSASISSLGNGIDAQPLARLPAANYIGVFGTMEADDSFPAPAGDGSIISGRRVRFAELERGQSHTLLVGERTAAMAPSTWLGVDFRGEDAACRLVGSAMTAPNCVVCDECEFASRHSGGANFVWADGHVSMLRDDINSIEYRLLAKRRAD